MRVSVARNGYYINSWDLESLAEGTYFDYMIQTTINNEWDFMFETEILKLKNKTPVDIANDKIKEWALNQIRRKKLEEI
jgi:hypothetical protein